VRRLALAAGFILACGAAQAATKSEVTIHSLFGDALQAALLKPDGAGPFPAVVMLHDCSGLGPRSSGAPGRWADELAEQGYVVLIPDSFTARGLPNGLCTLRADQQRGITGETRAADAYGALAYLRTLPFVDGTRVGVMGGSHGGRSTLSSMVVPATPANRLAEAKRTGFVAGIALYPSCAGPYGGWSTKRANGATGRVVSYSGVYTPIAPLLILIGEADDWTPAEDCRRLAQASRAAGHPVEIKIYPGVHHSFDNTAPVRFVEARTNANAPTGKGATTGGDAAAWEDARKEVAAFFARHLKSVSPPPTP
jgi:dienelactone hydrolase